MKRLVPVLLVVLCFAFVVSSFAQSGKLALRVDAGALAVYKDKAGNDWQPDQYYSKGKGYGFEGGDTVDRGADTKIEGTDDPRLYQTERYAMQAFTAEVPNGTYTVRLHFAETYSDITFDGPRVFDVKIQGKEALTDWDIYKTVGGLNKAVVKEFKDIAVSDGLLKIDFVTKQQSPEINAVEVLAQ